MTASEMTAREVAAMTWQDALKKIAEGDWPREHATIYRDDGKHSKHDLCPHGRRIYEDCDECVCAFARSVLDTPHPIEGKE